jgi:predicted O-linked N-acetylglucosamine transferase (SPINDLY family)
MNFSTYCLTSLRLAPLQVQMLGHPETSGSQNVDYVITPDLMESADAASHYRERVFRSPALGCAYTFDYRSSAPVDRAHFGLKDSDIVFVSPQSLYKYHPDDDGMYVELVEKVGENCKIVFLKSGDLSGFRIFYQRMRHVFESRGYDVTRHLIFIESPLPNSEFTALCGLSDVFVDNPSWSGHNTALDALHAGTLVVAHEGVFMRQRHASALMRHLGFDELVANNKHELIEICARFCRDKAYRERYRELLPTRIGRLSDAGAVQAFESFVLSELQKY